MKVYQLIMYEPEKYIPKVVKFFVDKKLAEKYLEDYKKAYEHDDYNFFLTEEKITKK